MTKPDPTQFLESPLGRTITQSSLDQELQSMGTWQERYRVLMKLGQRMPKLSDDLKHSKAAIRGCESQTWIYHHEQEGRHFFLADSEARIVRGLLVLILAACNGKTSEELERVKLQDWFKTLGLQTHLSPSRTNGLSAITTIIKTI